MSQEDVQAVRDAFDAFESEGIDGLLAHLDPQIEWTITGEFLSRRPIGATKPCAAT